MSIRDDHRFHPLNVSYLVMGLLFLGLAGIWALQAADVVEEVDLPWLLPLSLVLAGTVGLLAFVARGVRRGRGSTYDPERSERDHGTAEADAYLDSLRREDELGEQPAAPHVSHQESGYRPDPTDDDTTREIR